MATLTISRIGALLEPYTREAIPESVLEQLSVYLDLLLRWNARTNLTAIRDPEQIVRRHFGESLFAADHVPRGSATLLDLGSGAGFPGVPIQLVHRHLKVTLAESQNKKAAFLQEAVRTLGVGTTVWAGRAEKLSPSAMFDVVALRAVDNPADSLRVAAQRIRRGGSLLHLTVAGASDESCVEYLVPGSATVLRVCRQG